MRTTTKNTMKTWILGTAAAAVLLATGAVSANAAPQEFRGRGEQFGGRQHFEGRGEARGFDRGFNHGYDRIDARRFYRPGNNLVVENYIPPCPGDGYFWTAGYYNDGYWVPGVWTFGGIGYGRGYGHDRGYGYDRGFENRGYDHRIDRRVIENRGFENRGFENRGFENHRDAGRQFDNRAERASGRGGQRAFGGENHGRR